MMDLSTIFNSNVKYDFTGKVAVITGGANGQGRCTALRLCQAGAKVLVADYDDAGLAETVSLVRAAGGTIDSVHCDVRKREDCFAMVDKAVQLYGRIDLALNGAGVFNKPGVGFVDISEEEFNRVFEVNLRGYFWCLQAEIKQMLAQGGEGYSIVNISSIQGIIANVGSALYTTTKHAVIGLTKSVGLEYIDKGIRVNCFAPAAVSTKMLWELFDECGNPMTSTKTTRSPLGRYAEATECAECITWLLSDASTYMNASTVVMDAGMTVRGAT